MPFSALPEKDFVGKQEELDGLTKRIVLAHGSLARSAVLSGPRGMGKTELLKQLFGRLFWGQDRIAPFFYAANPAVLSAQAFSRTYLIRFLSHRLAYQKKEQALLYHNGMSIDDIATLAEERGATWAREILDRYERSATEPLDALRIALNAPHLSALATGTPVAVLIDEFQLLNGITIEGIPDPKLVSLFEEPMASGKTPHLITGNAPEIQEMAVSRSLERIPVQPLGTESALSRARALLAAQGAEGSVSPLLLFRLGGNPFYLACVVRTASTKKVLDEKDFWNAYIREIMEGPLSRSWSAVLKGFFPDLEMRRAALATAFMICHTAEPLSCRRIAKSLGLTDAQASATAQTLYLAGLIRGEFGVFRATEDRVVRDIIEELYRKEILAQTGHEREQHFLESLLPQQENAVRFEMTIPMAKESELVVAQCLGQIGKNLQLNEDAIGQMQIAVIEACINAIEHSKGMDNKVRIVVSVERGRLEVSIESAGPEFIMQETGEPVGDQAAAKASGRGWGVKLMNRFADKVVFERTAQGTRTILIKELGTSAGVRKEDTTNRE
jgi:serine/threonine-protein kinase RsbW